MCGKDEGNIISKKHRSIRADFPLNKIVFVCFDLPGFCLKDSKVDTFVSPYSELTQQGKALGTLKNIVRQINNLE